MQAETAFLMDVTADLRRRSSDIHYYVFFRDESKLILKGKLDDLT